MLARALQRRLAGARAARPGPSLSAAVEFLPRVLRSGISFRQDGAGPGSARAPLAGRMSNPEVQPAHATILHDAALVWFRRDLRAYDHAALSRALQRSR